MEKTNNEIQKEKEWKEIFQPIYEEVKDLKNDKEREEWVRKNPEKSAIVLSAFLVFTVEQSTFKE